MHKIMIFHLLYNYTKLLYEQMFIDYTFVLVIIIYIMYCIEDLTRLSIIILDIVILRSPTNQNS